MNKTISDYKFTKKEIAILKEYYPKEGIDVSKRIPGRSIEGIRRVATKLGLYSSNDSIKARWTPFEEKVLIDNYHKGVDTVQKELSWRSRNSIIKHANHLGISVGDFWSEEEEAILRQNYSKQNINISELLPGRSKSAIQHKAINLGLSKENPWEDLDLEILEKYFLTEYFDICMRLNKSYDSVKGKCYALVTNSNVIWSTSEIKLLIKNVGHMGVDGLSTVEGKSIFDCKKMADDLSLNANFWTIEEDLEILAKGRRSLLPDRTSEQIKWRSERLGQNAVTSKKFSREQREIIKDNFPSMGYKVLDKLPGVRYYQVIRYAKAVKMPVPRYTEEELQMGIEFIGRRINTEYGGNEISC